MFIRHTRDLALLLPCLLRLVRINDWAWWEGYKFDRAPVEGRDGFGERPHFSQRT